MGKYDREFKKIAKQNNISVKQLKREIQDAINEAYINPNLKAMSIPRENEIPTVEEVMDYARKELGQDKHDKEKYI